MRARSKKLLDDLLEAHHDYTFRGMYEKRRMIEIEEEFDTAKSALVKHIESLEKWSLRVK